MFPRVAEDSDGNGTALSLMSLGGAAAHVARPRHGVRGTQRMLRNVVAHSSAPLGMSRTRRVQSIVRSVVDAHPYVFVALWDARSASNWVAVHETRSAGGVRFEFL